MSQMQEFLSTVIKNFPLTEIPAKMQQDCIEGRVDVRALLRGAFAPPLIGENPRVELVSEKEWEAWKWVEIGMPNLRNAKDFRKDFKVNKPKLEIGEYADSILDHAESKWPLLL